MEFQISYRATDWAASARRIDGARAALQYVRDIQNSGLTLNYIEVPGGRRIGVAELDALAKGEV